MGFKSGLSIWITKILQIVKSFNVVMVSGPIEHLFLAARDLFSLYSKSGQKRSPRILANADP
jgi:hypothetical protein